MSFVFFPNFYLSAAADATAFFFSTLLMSVRMDFILARLRFWTVLNKKFSDWERS